MPIAAIPGGLNAFQLALEGTWTNVALPGAKHGEGGPDKPLSYNVMPLPQASAQYGYILKNHTVSEIVRFNQDNNQDPDAVAVPTTAPNRGASSLQVPTALYYEQQVFFGDGPALNAPPQPQVVHTENGSWLNLLTGNPLKGPYGPPTPHPPPKLDELTLQDPSQQPRDITIAKQMSIPHGNSILALGSFDAPSKGSPTIADTSSILPTPAGLNVDQYKTLLNQPDDYQNPNVDYTANPNLPLQQALKILNVTSYLHWMVTTEPLPSGQGATMNIPFEKRAARVAGYTANYWLLSTDGKDPDQASYQHLAYSQNILLEITIGGTLYSFPHWTTNIVTRKC